MKHLKSTTVRDSKNGSNSKRVDEARVIANDTLRTTSTRARPPTSAAPALKSARPTKRWRTTKIFSKKVTTHKYGRLATRTRTHRRRRKRNQRRSTQTRMRMRIRSKGSREGRREVGSTRLMVRVKGCGNPAESRRPSLLDTID